MKKYILGIVLGILALSLLSGCSKESAAAEQEPPPAIQGAAVAPLMQKSGSSQVYILGKEGFAPATLKISRGGTVRFVNNDPKQKDAVLTFQKDQSRSLFTSGIMKPQESWENRFIETGLYTYWTVGYGVKGRIVVE